MEKDGDLVGERISRHDFGKPVGISDPFTIGRRGGAGIQVHISPESCLTPTDPLKRKIRDHHHRYGRTENRPTRAGRYT